MTQLFDRGLQPERTSLSFSRTVLALAVVLLGGSRVAASLLGDGAVVLAVAAVAVLAALLAIGDRRYRRVNAALAAGGRIPTGGAMFATLAAVVAASGLLGAAFVVLLVVGR